MSNIRLPNRFQSAKANLHLSRRKLYAAMLVASQWMAAGQLWAAPEGGEVVGGAGVITQSGVDTMIHQATERMAIDWKSFDVGAKERVEFIQPSSSSIALNRVLSNRGSEILGRINSNGQVMLVNPNGVVFGKDSIINVGGMIASGMSIDPASFINGDFTLNSLEGTDGKVINYGIINAATGGSVTLVGQQVQNDGLISAKLGAVNLAAGKEAVLTFDQSGLVGIKVTEAVLQNELGVDAAVINNGDINAEGGRVLLSASVSEDIFSNAVNNAGMNKASSVVVHDDGSFTLGAGADIINAGDIDASVATGSAGQVIVVGNNITSSGTIAANAGTGSAGAIELHSTDTTLVTETGSVSAQANTHGEGGDIKILGNKVGLSDSAQVDASGANGGGQVLIGGDKTGQNKRVRNADFIYLGEHTNVKTDALIDGDGGKLITFASDTARIYGNLYSRGGSEGGNGGFIETSGLKGFEILNAPDVGASVGGGGLWLIDPFNITIVTFDELKDDFLDDDPDKKHFASTKNSILSITTLNTALGKGDVSVQTGDGGKDSDGKITLSTAVNYSGSDVRTLTFDAHNGIEINASILSDNAKLNLEFNANTDGNNSGDITIKSGETVFNTNGGYLNAKGVAFTLDATGDDGVETHGGDVNLDMTGSIGIFSNIETSGGKFTATGTTFVADNLDETVIDTVGQNGSGNVEITTSVSVKLGNINVGNNLLIQGDKDFTTDAIEAANINITQFVLDDPEKNDAARKLIVAGSTTFDAGDAGDITLLNQDNNFAGNIALKSARNVSLNDADSNGLTFGEATIAGKLVLTSTGDVKFQDSATVPVAQNIKAASVSVINSGAFFSGDINTVGAEDVAGGNVTITSTGTVKIGNIDSSASTASTTPTIGKNGGAVKVSGDSVTIGTSATDVAINTSGAIGATTNGNGGDITVTAKAKNAGNYSIVVNGDINALPGGTTGLSGTVLLELVAGDFATANGDATLNSNKILSTDVEVRGSTGIDTLSGPDDDNAWRLGSSTSTLAKTGSTNADAKITFSNFEVLVGGSGNDSLTGIAQANDWQITGVNAGSVKLKGAATGINFSSFNSLNGNATEDIFSFTTNGRMENVGGGGGVNTIIGRNVGTTWTLTGANAGGVKLTNSSNYVDAFTGIQNLTGGTAADIFDFNPTNPQPTNPGSVSGTIDGGSSGEGNTILARKGTGVKNTWSMDQDESGSLAQTNGVADPYVHRFEDIQIFTGAGSDTMSYASATSAVTVTLGKSGVSGVTNFVGSTVANVDSTLIGEDKANNWSITGPNSGNVRSEDQDETSAIGFSNFNNLRGGSKADIFDFTKSVSGRISGQIDGGNGADTIIARNVANTWKITTENKDALAETLGDTYLNGFVDIQTLTGGSLADIFTIDKNFNGTINGGDGADIFNVNAIANNLRGDDGNDKFIFGSELNNGSAEIINGGDGENELVGRATDNTWIIKDGIESSLGLTAGAVYVKSFSNIHTLTGGIGADIFTINANFEGEINSGLGNNIYNINTAVKVLTGGAGNDSFIFGVNGVADNINGGGGTNTITGRDGGNTWTMTGENKGDLAVTGTQSNTLYLGGFEKIQVLQGGIGVDIFNLNQAFSGVVKGGAGADIFNVNAATNILQGETGDDSFLFTSESNTGSAASVDGGTASENNSLVGRDGSNTWTMTAENKGNLAVTGTPSNTIYVTGFENIQTLQGGIEADTFNFNHAFSGAVKGGAGADIFYVNAATNILQGETGDDSFVFNNASSTGSATRVDGGAASENNSLTGRDGSNTWIITTGNKGNLSVTGTPSNTLYLTGFENIQTLQGGGAVDTFNVNNSFSGVIKGGAGADIFNLNAAITNVQGDSGSDRFLVNSISSSGIVTTINGGADVDGLDLDEVNLGALTSDVSVGVGAAALGDVRVINVESLIANAEKTNTLIADNLIDNTWKISATNKGAVNTIGFSGFANLVGGKKIDTFTFIDQSANVTGWIDAGDGVDRLDLTKSNRDLVVHIADTHGVANAGEITAENVEQIAADTDNNNRLVAGNAENTWLVTSVNGGTLNGVISFADFKNLTGGSQNDTFSFGEQGTITGLVDGGGQTGYDKVDVSNSANPNIVITAENTVGGYSNIEKYIGNNTTSTIMGDNKSNEWVINNNGGTINGTVEFERFANLIGGSEQDKFTLTNANLSGYIDGAGGNDVFTFGGNGATGELRGGAGSDEFNLVVVDGATGTTKITGGDGTNSLRVSGGGTGYSASHGLGVVEYESQTKATYAAEYSGISKIDDTAIADSLAIQGTSENDIFSLQNGNYQLNPTLVVNYSQKQSLIINGSPSDQVILDGNVSIPKTMTVYNASLNSVNEGKLSGQALELVSTKNVGSESNRVQLAVDDLYLKSTNGDIYINEQNSLSIKEFSTSETKVFDLTLGGDLLSTVGIVYTGQFNINALRGAISLNNGNSFTGNLNLKTTGDITLKNTTSVKFGEVSAQNLTVETNEDVSGSGPIIVNGLASISANSTVTFLHADNDFNSVRVLKASDVSLSDKNNLTLAGVSAVGQVTVNTNGSINIGASCTDNCADSSGVSATSLSLNAGAGSITVGKNIVVSDTAKLLANGITVNDVVSGKNITLNAGSGTLLLNSSGHLNGQAGKLIDLSGNRVEQYSTITGGGDINVVAIDDIQMMKDAKTESISGNISYSGKNIALASVKASAGAVRLSATGAITDSNGDNTNITAKRWDADANAGIGVGRLGDEGQDAIETDVDVLSVRNAGKLLGYTEARINIVNADSLTIEQLRNNGDISITNVTGDFILDNSHNERFDITKADARLQGGVINTNTGPNGGSLTVSLPSGMVSAGVASPTNRANKENPDIIASIASFNYPTGTRFSFGDRNRKIVMHIPDVYNQTARTSSVVWHLRKPNTIVDQSKALTELDSLTSDQLIQIEWLNEIDPAIFTDVRNYIHDEVAILMPADQRFDDDEFAE